MLSNLMNLNVFLILFITEIKFSLFEDKVPFTPSLDIIIVPLILLLKKFKKFKEKNSMNWLTGWKKKIGINQT